MPPPLTAHFLPPSCYPPPCPRMLLGCKKSRTGLSHFRLEQPDASRFSIRPQQRDLGRPGPLRPRPSKLHQHHVRRGEEGVQVCVAVRRCPQRSSTSAHLEILGLVCAGMALASTFFLSLQIYTYCTVDWIYNLLAKPCF